MNMMSVLKRVGDKNGESSYYHGDSIFATGIKWKSFLALLFSTKNPSASRSDSITLKTSSLDNLPSLVESFENESIIIISSHTFFYEVKHLFKWISSLKVIMIAAIEILFISKHVFL